MMIVSIHTGNKKTTAVDHQAVILKLKNMTFKDLKKGKSKPGDSITNSISSSVLKISENGLY
jgi:hypothetical protein